MANGNARGRASTKSPSSSVQAVLHSRWHHFGSLVAVVSISFRAARDAPFGAPSFISKLPAIIKKRDEAYESE